MWTQSQQPAARLYLAEVTHCWGINMLGQTDVIIKEINQAALRNINIKANINENEYKYISGSNKNKHKT